MPVKTVSAKEICQILAGDGHEPLTEMAVSKFVAEGMPKAARGTYDPMVCLHWYVGRLRTSVKRKETETPDGSMVSLDKEQIRLTRAKADNEEMTAAERRRALIPIHVYEDRQARREQILKTKLMDLPNRIAPKIVDGLTRAEAKALMLAAVKGMCAELAQNKHVDEQPASGSRSVPASDAKRGGSRRPRTTRRG